MKILLVSTTDVGGGAAIACNRLMTGFHAVDTPAKMLVQEQLKPNPHVVSTTKTKIKQLTNFYRFAYERFCFYRHERSKDVRFAFSLANTGENICNHELVQQADIVNLHWVNRGFMSLQSLEKLFATKKPIVWTLHDMWAFTGGCHYTGDCENYMQNCGNCAFVKNPSATDLSSVIWKRKQKLYENANITFVTSSNWLAESARKSGLLKKFRVESIPIPVNTTIFAPMDNDGFREELNLPKNKKLILFGAMNVNDTRKGFKYFREALDIFVEKNPEKAKESHLVVFGKSRPETIAELPFPAVNLGFINSETQLAKIFNAVDLFVIPSLEDNLPNIIMESLACETPVLAFETGGIPQMIDHKKTGYLAQYKSSNDLSNGLKYCLFDANNEEMRKNSRKKIMETFSEKIVTKKYLKLYKEIVNLQKEK